MGMGLIPILDGVPGGGLLTTCQDLGHSRIVPIPFRILFSLSRNGGVSPNCPRSGWELQECGFLGLARIV